jgi:2-succinyl-5-enolpyruvyl-6-hydroxy-3-cyclohexene-1-carboxylate synthase
VAASNAIRYLDLVPAPRRAVRVFASRGAAGIDGTLSTASGIAYALGEPVRVLLGDLALFHDAGGLAVGEHELAPDLDAIVLNDRGGGIFRTLEHAEAVGEAAFGRYFLAPQRVDLRSLARAYAARYVLADSVSRLQAILAEAPVGVRIVEVPL